MEFVESERFETVSDSRWGRRVTCVTDTVEFTEREGGKILFKHK